VLDGTKIYNRFLSMLTQLVKDINSGIAGMSVEEFRPFHPRLRTLDEALRMQECDEKLIEELTKINQEISAAIRRKNPHL